MATKDIMRTRLQIPFSAIVGNVTGIIKWYVVNNFPNNYFKDINIDTALTRKKRTDDIMLNQLPRLDMFVEFDPSDYGIMGKDSRWRKGSNFILKNQKNLNYQNVFYNDQDHYYLYTIPNRTKVTFNFQIRVKSRMRAYDVAKYITQSQNPEQYFYLNSMPIEGIIPNSFIQAMIDDRNIDISDNTEFNEFNDYLKQHSQGYIMRKKNLSTGNYIYTHRYLANVLCMFEGEPSISGEGRDQEQENYNVEFSLSTELWTPGDYIFEGKEIPDYDALEEMDLLQDNDYSFINYTLGYMPKKSKDDKTLIFYQGYVTGDDELIDIVDLSPLFDENLLELIQYNLDNGINNDDYFDIDIRQDGNLLPEEDYNFEWNTLELETIFPQIGMTYHVVLYGDNDKIQEQLEIINEK